LVTLRAFQVFFSQNKHLLTTEGLLDVRIALYEAKIAREDTGGTLVDDLKEIGNLAMNAGKYQLAIGAFEEVARTDSAYKCLLFGLHYQLKDWAKIEVAVLAVNAPPLATGQALTPEYLTTLRICYQEMGTSEAVKLNLALSSVNERR
jgi:tetratricopeptide (TPR) repeat protein